MTSKDSRSLPLTLLRVANAFRLTGWIGFWLQLVLAVVAALTLLFSVLFANPNRNPSTNASNPGTGVGVLLAACGLVVLFVSVYWAFRYTRLANQLKAPSASARPKKAETLKALRMGLMVNLVGMLLSLLGAESIAGVLLARASQSQGALYAPGGITSLIQPLDISVVLANTHIILAHFAGLATSLWLLNVVNRPS